MTRFHHHYHSARHLRPAYVLFHRDTLRAIGLAVLLVGMFLAYGYLLHVSQTPRAAVTWEETP